MEETGVYRSHRCLITYGASGRNITHELMTETGSFQVDECYTLAQRDLKYTLVHFKQRVVRSSIAQYMRHLDEKYGIKNTDVFGYDSISIGNEIDSHPGMMLIIENANKTESPLECWMAEGTLKENRHGLLFSHLDEFDIEKMSKTQLVKHAKQLKRKLDEFKLQTENLSAENQRAASEIRRLKLRLDTQKYVFTKAGRAHQLLPPSP